MELSNHLIEASLTFDGGLSETQNGHYVMVGDGRLVIKYKKRMLVIEDLVLLISIWSNSPLPATNAQSIKVYCNDIYITSSLIELGQRCQILIPVPPMDGGAMEIDLRADICEIPPQINLASISSEFPLKVNVLGWYQLSSLYQDLEERMVWIFGSARSGSSWLAEILCSHHRSRPMDETMIGAFFGCFSWEPENVLDAALKRCHYKPALILNKGVTSDEEGVSSPPFRRMIASSYFRPQSSFSHKSRDLLMKTARNWILEHIILEWGISIPGSGNKYQNVIMKCPNESHAADILSLCFPKSSFIFLIRDGRDIIDSRFAPFSSLDLGEYGRDTEKRLSAIAYFSHFWNFQTDIVAAAFENHEPARRLLVRYEDLRYNPVPNILRIFDVLGYQDTEDEIIKIAEKNAFENLPATERGENKPRRKARPGGYRDSFSETEIQLMNDIMGDNLKKYGYM